MLFSAPMNNNVVNILDNDDPRISINLVIQKLEMMRTSLSNDDRMMSIYYNFEKQF